ncbi:MAG TPA: UPF0158 family protein [Nitrospiraceae bacterium]
MSTIRSSVRGRSNIGNQGYGECRSDGSRTLPMEHNAYISLDTGQIYWVSDLNPIDEELPDDFDTSDRYIALPHKNELGLGQNLALRLAQQELPDRYEKVETIFRSNGAYARFKDLLESAGRLEKWYKFEEASLDEALQEWCAANDIEIIKGQGGSSA